MKRWDDLYKRQLKLRADAVKQEEEQTNPHIQFASNPFAVNEQQLFQNPNSGEMNRKLVEVDQQEVLATGNLKNASKYIAAEWNTPAVPTPEDAMLYKARLKQIQDWEDGYYKYANNEPFAHAYNYYKQKGYTSLADIKEDQEANKLYFGVADQLARKDFFDLLKKDYEIEKLQRQGLNNRRFQLGLQPAAGTPVVLQKVLDGDTYDVLDQDGKTKRVRAVGFDAFESFDNDHERFMKQYLGVDITPEEARKRGKQTKADMEALVGQTIYLGANAEGQEKDKYDRYLHNVFLPDGQNVAEKYKNTDYDALTAVSPFHKKVNDLVKAGIVSKTTGSNGEEILSVAKGKGKEFSEYYRDLVAMDVELDERQMQDARSVFQQMSELIADALGGSQKDIDAFTKQHPLTKQSNDSLFDAAEGLWRAGVHMVWSDMLPSLSEMVYGVGKAVAAPWRIPGQIAEMFEPEQVSKFKLERKEVLKKLTPLMYSAPDYKEDSGGLPYIDEGHELNLTDFAEGKITSRRHGETEWQSPTAFGNKNIHMVNADMLGDNNGEFVDMGVESGDFFGSIPRLIAAGITKFVTTPLAVLNPYSATGRPIDPMAFSNGVADLTGVEADAKPQGSNWYMRNGALISLIGEMGSSFAIAGNAASKIRDMVDNMPGFITRLTRANKAAQKIGKWSEQTGSLLSGLGETYEAGIKLKKAANKIERAEALANLNRLQKFGAWYQKKTGDLGEGALTFAFAKYLSENGQVTDEELMQAAESGAIYRGVGDAIGHAFGIAAQKATKWGLGRFSVLPDKFMNEALGKAASVQISTLNALSYKVAYMGAQGPAGVAQEMMSTLMDDGGYEKFKERFFTDPNAAENWINAYMQGYVMMMLPMSRNTINRLLSPTKNQKGAWGQAKMFEEGIQMIKRYAEDDQVLAKYFAEGNPDIYRVEDVVERLQTDESVQVAEEAVVGVAPETPPADIPPVDVPQTEQTVEKISLEGALPLEDNENVEPINVVVETTTSKEDNKHKNAVMEAFVAPPEGEASIAEQPAETPQPTADAPDIFGLTEEQPQQMETTVEKPAESAKSSSIKIAEVVKQLDTDSVEKAITFDPSQTVKVGTDVIEAGSEKIEKTANNVDIDGMFFEVDPVEEIDILTEKAKTLVDNEVKAEKAKEEAKTAEAIDAEPVIAENAVEETDANGKPTVKKKIATTKTPASDYHQATRLTIQTEDGPVYFTNADLELLNMANILRQKSNEGQDLSIYRFYSLPTGTGSTVYGFTNPEANAPEGERKVFLNATPENVNMLSTTAHEPLHPYLRQNLIKNMTDDEVTEALFDLRENFGDLESWLRKKAADGDGKLSTDRRVLEEMLATINGYRLANDNFTSVAEAIVSPMRVLEPGMLQRFENKLKSVAKLVDFKQSKKLDGVNIDPETLAKEKGLMKQYMMLMDTYTDLKSKVTLTPEDQETLIRIKKELPALQRWHNQSLVSRAKSDKFVPQTLLLQRIFNKIEGEGVSTGIGLMSTGNQGFTERFKQSMSDRFYRNGNFLADAFKIVNDEFMTASMEEVSFGLEDRYDRSDSESLSLASLNQIERLMGVDKGTMVNNVKNPKGAWSTYEKFEKDVLKSLAKRYHFHRDILKYYDPATGEVISSLSRDKIVVALKQRYQDLHKHVPYHGVEINMRNGKLTLKRVEAGEMVGSDIQRGSKVTPTYVPDATNFKQATKFFNSVAKRTNGYTSKFFEALANGQIRHVAHTSAFSPAHNRMGKQITLASDIDVRPGKTAFAELFIYDKDGNARNESIYYLGDDGQYFKMTTRDISKKIKDRSFDPSRLTVNEFVSSGSNSEIYKTEGFFDAVYANALAEITAGNKNLLIPMMHGANSMSFIDVDLTDFLEKGVPIQDKLAEVESFFLKDYIANKGEIDFALPPELDNSEGQLTDSMDFVKITKFKDDEGITRAKATYSDIAATLLASDNGKKLKPFIDSVIADVDSTLANEMGHIISGLEFADLQEMKEANPKSGVENYTKYALAKIFSLTDAAQSLALDPSADWISPYEYDKATGAVKWNKLHQKYSKALMRGNNAPDLDVISGMYPDMVTNGQFQPPKGVSVVTDRNGKRQLAMKTLVFDPEAYKAEFGEHHPIFRVFGPTRLDGGSMIIEPETMRFVNRLHGGADTGSIKSEYRVLTENGSLHIKHAEHSILQDDFDVATDPELYAFLNALRDQGITMLTPTSATKMKGDRKPKRVKSPSTGKDFAVGMRGNILGEYDKQGQIKPIKVGGTKTAEGESGGKTVGWLLFDEMGKANLPVVDNIGLLDVLLTGDDGLKYMASKKEIHGDASSFTTNMIPGFFPESEYWSPEAERAMHAIAERNAADFDSALGTLAFFGTQLANKKLAYLDKEGEEAQTHGRHLMAMKRMLESKLSKINDLTEMPSDAEMRAVQKLKDIVSERIDKTEAGSKKVYTVDFAKLASFLLNENAIFSNPKDKQLFPKDEFHSGVGTSYFSYLKTLADQTVMMRFPGKNMVYAPTVNAIGGFFRLVAHDLKAGGMNPDIAKNIALELANTLPLAKKQVITEIDPMTGSKKTVYGDYVLAGQEEFIKNVIASLSPEAWRAVDKLKKTGVLIETPNGFEIDGIDLDQNNYSAGSKAMMLSADWFDKHHDKDNQQSIFNRRTISYVTPPDNVASILPFNVRGLFPEGQINRVSYASDIAMGLQGKDMDIDTMSVATYDNKRVTREEFDTIYDTLDKARSKVLASKKRVESFRAYGKKIPTEYLTVKIPYTDQTTRVPRAWFMQRKNVDKWGLENGLDPAEISKYYMAYPELPFGGEFNDKGEVVFGNVPLNAGFFKHNREHTSEKLIGMAAWATNAMATFYQRHPQGFGRINLPIMVAEPGASKTFERLSEETGQATFKEQIDGAVPSVLPIVVNYDKDRMAHHVAMVKEGSVDNFNHLGFQPDAIEMAAHSMVEGYALKTDSERAIIRAFVRSLLEQQGTSISHLKGNKVNSNWHTYDVFLPRETVDDPGNMLISAFAESLKELSKRDDVKFYKHSGDARGLRKEPVDVKKLFLYRETDIVNNPRTIQQMFKARIHASSKDKAARLLSGTSEIFNRPQAIPVLAQSRNKHLANVHDYLLTKSTEQLMAASGLRSDVVNALAADLYNVLTTAIITNADNYLYKPYKINGEYVVPTAKAVRAFVKASLTDQKKWLHGISQTVKDGEGLFAPYIMTFSNYNADVTAQIKEGGKSFVQPVEGLRNMGTFTEFDTVFQDVRTVPEINDGVPSLKDINDEYQIVLFADKQASNEGGIESQSFKMAFKQKNGAIVENTIVDVFEYINNGMEANSSFKDFVEANLDKITKISDVDTLDNFDAWLLSNLAIETRKSTSQAVAGKEGIGIYRFINPVNDNNRADIVAKSIVNYAELLNPDPDKVSEITGAFLLSHFNLGEYGMTSIAKQIKDASQEAGYKKQSFGVKSAEAIASSVSETISGLNLAELNGKPYTYELKKEMLAKAFGIRTNPDTGRLENAGQIFKLPNPLLPLAFGDYGQVIMSEALRRGINPTLGERYVSDLVDQLTLGASNMGSSTDAFSMNSHGMLGSIPTFIDKRLSAGITKLAKIGKGEYSKTRKLIDDELTRTGKTWQDFANGNASDVVFDTLAKIYLDTTGGKPYNREQFRKEMKEVLAKPVDKDNITKHMAMEIISTMAQSSYESYVKDIQWFEDGVGSTAKGATQDFLVALGDVASQLKKKQKEVNKLSYFVKRLLGDDSVLALSTLDNMIDVYKADSPIVDLIDIGWDTNTKRAHQLSVGPTASILNIALGKTQDSIGLRYAPVKMSLSTKHILGATFFNDYTKNEIGKLKSYANRLFDSVFLKAQSTVKAGTLERVVRASNAMHDVLGEILGADNLVVRHDIKDGKFFNTLVFAPDNVPEVVEARFEDSSYENIDIMAKNIINKDSKTLKRIREATGDKELSALEAEEAMKMVLKNKLLVSGHMQITSRKMLETLLKQRQALVNKGLDHDARLYDDNLRDLQQFINDTHLDPVNPYYTQALHNNPFRRLSDSAAKLAVNGLADKLIDHINTYGDNYYQALDGRKERRAYHRMLRMFDLQAKGNLPAKDAIALLNEVKRRNEMRKNSDHSLTNRTARGNSLYGNAFLVDFLPKGFKGFGGSVDKMSLEETFSGLEKSFNRIYAHGAEVLYDAEVRDYEMLGFSRNEIIAKEMGGFFARMRGDNFEYSTEVMPAGYGVHEVGTPLHIRYNTAPTEGNELGQTSTAGHFIGEKGGNIYLLDNNRVKEIPINKIYGMHKGNSMFATQAMLHNNLKKALGSVANVNMMEANKWIMLPDRQKDLSVVTAELMQKLPSITVAAQYLGGGILLAGGAAMLGTATAAVVGGSVLGAAALTGMVGKVVTKAGDHFSRVYINNYISGYREAALMLGFEVFKNKVDIDAIANKMQVSIHGTDYISDSAPELAYFDMYGAPLNINEQRSRIDSKIKELKDAESIMRSFASFEKGELSQGEIMKTISVAQDLINSKDYTDPKVIHEELKKRYLFDESLGLTDKDGFDLASAIAAKSQLNKVMFNTFSGLARFVYRSEGSSRITAMASAKFMRERYAPQQSRNVYDPVESAILNAVADRTVGQYGQLTKLTKDTSPLGRMLKMYSRYHKRNFIYHFFDNWKNVDKENMLKEMEAEHPELFVGNLTTENIPEYTRQAKNYYAFGAGYGLLMAGAFTELNALIASMIGSMISDEFDEKEWVASSGANKGLGRDYLGIGNFASFAVQGLYNTLMYALSYNAANEEAKVSALLSGEADIAEMAKEYRTMAKTPQSMLYPTGSGQGVATILDGTFGMLMQMYVYSQLDKGISAPIYQAMYDKQLTNGAGDIMRSILKGTPGVSIAKQYGIDPYVTGYMRERNRLDTEEAELLGTTEQLEQEKRYKSFREVENDLGRQILPSGQKLSPEVTEQGKIDASNAKSLKNEQTKAEKLKKLLN